MYLEVLVIAEYLDNILFCYFSKILKIIFENENLAIFAGNSQKFNPDTCLHTCLAQWTATLLNQAGLTILN